MMRAAVVGVGSMGHNHARVYNDLASTELVAVVDANPATAHAEGSRLKVAAYSNVDDMLDRERPGVVSVVVPTSMHFEVARLAIERGIHVLVEKPITQTLAQAGALIALAEDHNVRLAVGHIERFNPAVIELGRRLAASELGDVFQIHAQRLSPFPTHIGDVGVVMDLATHEFDIMHYLLGSEVEYLFAATGRAIHTAHEDMLSCLLHFENGVTGVVDINWLTPTKVRQLRVTGSRGMFIVDYLLQDLYFFENSYDPEPWGALALLKGVGEGNMLKIHVSKVEPLMAELSDFVDAAITGRAPSVTGFDGLRALTLAQAALRSGRERRVVEIGNHLAPS